MAHDAFVHGEFLTSFNAVGKTADDKKDGQIAVFVTTIRSYLNQFLSNNSWRTYKRNA